MRDILPVGSTDRDTIRYIVDNGGEGGPAMVAAGGTKPQIDRDLEIKDALVKKIATYFRIPEEMVEDIPYMQSFLTQIGVEEVMAIEDAQILTGDGTGNNLNGVYTTATAFTQAAAGVAVVTAPNEYDVDPRCTGAVADCKVPTGGCDPEPGRLVQHDQPQGHDKQLHCKVVATALCRNCPACAC
jgi:HK97 family phage major capsid protein